MNKKINEYFASKGFTIGSNSFYGTVDGYEVNVTFTQTYVLVHISLYGEDENKKNLAVGLKATNKRINNIMPTILGVNICITNFTYKLLLTDLDNVFSILGKLATENNLLGVGYCPFCGEPLTEENTKTIDTHFGKITLEEKCIQSINTAIEQENKDFANRPNNYLKGFFGAVIGALAGVILYVILFLIGVISAFSSLLAIILGVYLYKLFGGKPNYVMIGMTTGVSLVSILLTFLVLYIVAATGLCVEANINFTGIDALKYCLENSAEFKAGFIQDIITNIVFLALGTGYALYSTSKSIKRINSISK